MGNFVYYAVSSITFSKDPVGHDKLQDGRVQVDLLQAKDLRD